MPRYSILTDPSLREDREGIHISTSTSFGDHTAASAVTTSLTGTEKKRSSASSNRSTSRRALERERKEKRAREARERARAYVKRHELYEPEHEERLRRERGGKTLLERRDNTIECVRAEKVKARMRDERKIASSTQVMLSKRRTVDAPTTTKVFRGEKTAWILVTDPETKRRYEWNSVTDQVRWTTDTNTSEPPSSSSASTNIKSPSQAEETIEWKYGADATQASTSQRRAIANVEESTHDNATSTTATPKIRFALSTTKTKASKDETRSSAFAFRRSTHSKRRRTATATSDVSSTIDPLEPLGRRGRDAPAPSKPEPKGYPSPGDVLRMNAAATRTRGEP